MNPLFREYAIAWLKLRIWHRDVALRQMGPLHEDVPMVLREKWDLTQRLHNLESLRCPHQR
jgi:hypothetical protein